MPGLHGLGSTRGRPIRTITSVVWPAAAYTTFASLGGPHPLTVHYQDGPVPWVDLRQTGTTDVYRVWCGETREIPYDGVNGWEIRPARHALDVLLSALATPATLSLSILLDSPPSPSSPCPGLIRAKGTYSSDDADPATLFFNVGAQGIARAMIVAVCTTFATGATCQLRGRIILDSFTVTIADNTIGATLAALNAVRTGTWGDWGFTPTNIWATTPTIIGGGDADAYGLTADGATSDLVFTWEYRAWLIGR